MPTPAEPRVPSVVVPSRHTRAAETRSADREAQRARARDAASPERRIVALVMPALLVELAEPGLPQAEGAQAEQPRARGEQPRAHAEQSRIADRRPRLPVAVVLEEESMERDPAEAIAATSVLSAVNDVARRLGVREGQTVAEARAFSSRLVVRSVARPVLEQGLGRIAEIALGFGPLVAFSAPDTVWVDVTGIAHLFGGEAGLAAELAGRVREAGHRARVAIADGPVLAQAFARFGTLGGEGFCLVPSRETREQFGKLPLRALNLPSELESWFVRLGVLTVADLTALPRNALGARLAEHTKRVLDLAEGLDTAPLVRFEPPRTLIEETSWEEPVDGREPLLFVLRGLVARISARLSGRGESAQEMVLKVVADPIIARFRKAPRVTMLEFSLPKPLNREEELRRILASRLERLTLGAPSIGLRLEVVKLTESMPRQLELGSLLVGAKSDAWDELPIVLAELGADIGHEHVGVLKTEDSHRPELTSRLVPALKAAEKPPLRKARPPLALASVSPANSENPADTGAALGLPPGLQRLTRLLPEPVPFEAPLRAGASVVFDHRLYTIESVRFEHRLEAVEWWSRAVHRDYVRVILRGANSVVEALAYVDRETGRRYVQGIFD